MRPGQRRGSQDRVDLPAQPTARDKHQPLDALREQVVELHRDSPAEGVPDEGDPLNAEAVQQVAHRCRVGAEGIVSHRLV